MEKMDVAKSDRCFGFLFIILAYGLLNAGLKWLDKESTDIGAFSLQFG